MDTFEEIVESYMPAARILMLSRAHVEMVIRRATRLEKLCPSCRFSRARHDVEKVACQRGTLDIYRRRCIFQQPRRKCHHWKRLELPIEVLETA